jgi:hypothetical protein
LNVDVVVVPGGSAALKTQERRGNSQADREMRFDEDPVDFET